MRSASQPVWKRAAWTGSAISVRLVCLVLLFTGCGGGGFPGGEEPASPVSVSAAESASSDAADLHFVQSMVPHHDQAIVMSGMVLEKTGIRPEVRAVAEATKAFHGSQLEKMNTWSGAQERSAHGEAEEDRNAHHGGEGGRMTEAQMMELDIAEVATAQVLFLDGMIRHHRGAVAMAETEVRDGKNPDAIALAEAIIENHAREVATMVDLRAKI